MPKPDALDVAVSAALLTLTMIVAPVLVGRSVTPHLDGEPQRLRATILAEQRYIAQARETLALCAAIEAYLSDLPSAEQAFDASVQLQDRVDAADRAWSTWEATEPPGRFPPYTKSCWRWSSCPATSLARRGRTMGTLTKRICQTWAADWQRRHGNGRDWRPSSRPWTLNSYLRASVIARHCWARECFRSETLLGRVSFLCGRLSLGVHYGKIQRLDRDKGTCTGHVLGCGGRVLWQATMLRQN